MKRMILGILAVFMLLSGSLAVLAAPDAVNSTYDTVRQVSAGKPAPMAQAINAEGGNITQINITSTQQTGYWQGFYGNISGSITLQNSAGNKFYDWSIANPTGEVYFSALQSVTWANVDKAGPPNNLSAEQTTAGFPVGYSGIDNVTNTYTLGAIPDFCVGAAPCYASTSAFRVKPYDNNAISRYYSILLWETSANYAIYAGIVNSTLTAFSGESATMGSFEVMVPASATPRTFYVYAELQ